MTIATHISRLRNHADLTSAGIPVRQASRIVFNIDSYIEINIALISQSLTNCIQNYLDHMIPEEIEEFIKRVNGRKCEQEVVEIACDEDGVWELMTPTFIIISLGEISFDDRLIYMDILEEIL